MFNPKWTCSTNLLWASWGVLMLKYILIRCILHLFSYNIFDWYTSMWRCGHNGRLWGWRNLERTGVTSSGGRRVWRDENMYSYKYKESRCLHTYTKAVSLYLLSFISATWGWGVGTVCLGTGGGETMTVSGGLPTPIASTWQYFVSRMLANWLAPTLRLLRASVSVFQLVLSLVVNQVLSISRSWRFGSGNCACILSNIPTLTLSWSPRWYHCADTSRTSSITWPRSSKVSLFPERSRKDMFFNLVQLWKGTATPCTAVGQTSVLFTSHCVH